MVEDSVGTEPALNKDDLDSLLGEVNQVNNYVGLFVWLCKISNLEFIMRLQASAKIKSFLVIFSIWYTSFNRNTFNKFNHKMILQISGKNGRSELDVVLPCTGTVNPFLKSVKIVLQFPLLYNLFL